MNPKQSLVLLTGGTGYIGSWILYHLLEKGYDIRATARESKVESLKKTHAQAGDRLQVVEIKDMETDDLTRVFEGVTALIHTASPTPSAIKSPSKILQGHLQGIENIVKTAVKAGVSKIVYTGALHGLYGSDLSVLYTPEALTENDWGKESPESITSESFGDNLTMYLASHSVAEKKFWELADQNPQVDFTSILPTMVYGGWVPGFPDERKSVGSSRFIYSLLIGEEGSDPKSFPKFPFSAQVHGYDVARAHVKALEAPPLADKRKKRFIISQGNFTYVDAIKLLKRERPELADRLPNENDPQGQLQSTKKFDTSFAEEVLGMKQEEYIKPEKTYLDTIDQFVEWEKATDFGRKL